MHKYIHKYLNFISLIRRPYYTSKELQIYDLELDNIYIKKMLFWVSVENLWKCFGSSVNCCNSFISLKNCNIYLHISDICFV